MPQLMRAQEIGVFKKTFLKKTLEEADYIKEREIKLIEGASEVKSAQTKEESLEELADLLEAINSLSQTLNFPFKEIEAKRLQKPQEKGGFSQRIYNAYVEISMNNPAINYYLKRPLQYPEIT